MGALVVDRKFVERVLREVEENVALAEQVGREGKDLFDADKLRRYGAQYALLAAIEGVIALAHHLIAECAFETPERNVDSVEILVREGVVTDPRLRENLAKMVRFRNLLVHRYWQVDPEAVWTILQENLGDLRTYCSQVAAFLDHNPGL